MRNTTQGHFARRDHAIIVGNYRTDLGHPVGQDLDILDELKMSVRALGRTW